MIGTTLTLRELNRATLARQLLLERTPLSALETLKQLVGLQAQLTNPPYIGLWTRLHAFRRSDLTHLIERKQAVRATMMRATLHLMAAEDYALLRLALQPALTRSMHGFFAKSAKDLDVEPIIAATHTRVQERPRTGAELRSILATLFSATDPALLAYAARTHLPLVQIYPGGTWGFTGQPAHAEASAWLGRPLVSPAEGLPLLITRYLAAFGPATVKDIQVWSGLTRLQGAVNDLRPALRTFRDEQGHELFDLPDRPLPPAHLPAPPRFLPEFDNLLLSHADRRRFVPDEYRSSIFLTVGRVRAIFLVDGFAAGTWKIERVRATARLVIEPFASLTDATRDVLAEEAEKLARFIEDDADTYEIQFSA